MTSTDLPSPTDVPVACTLSATDMRQRQSDIARLAAASLRSRTAIDGGQRLAFTADRDTADRIDRLVVAEAACCPFLRMDIRRDGELVIVDVTGPADAQPIIEQFFLA